MLYILLLEKEKRRNNEKGEKARQLFPRPKSFSTAFPRADSTDYIFKANRKLSLLSVPFKLTFLDATYKRDHAIIFFLHLPYFI
jgi:hypothetical protein